MDTFGLQSASGHLTVPPESKEPYDEQTLAELTRDAAVVVARYPQSRSALLPLLHLVQSVDGYITGRGIRFCAETLDLTTAEVSGVATFYTQYKRHPNGEYTVGVCTNTLCAIMGGDQIFETVAEHLGIGHDETTPDGTITLERVECNAACDYAPVVMANWEFFDNATPQSAVELVDDLVAGRPVTPTRGPSRVCTFKEVSRVLAGFHDGLADEGVGAGPASLVGLQIAHERGWRAPESPYTQAVASGEGPEQARDEAPVGQADDGASSDGSPDEADVDAVDEAEDVEDTPQEGDAQSPQAASQYSSSERASGDGLTATESEDSMTSPDAHAGSADAEDGDTGDTGDTAGASSDTTSAEDPTTTDDPTDEQTVIGDPRVPATLFGDEAPEVAQADRGDFADGGFGPASARPGPDGSGPAGWDVKGNADSMLFHGPESPWYKRTKAEVWFRDAEAARQAGFADVMDRRRKDKS